jgi:hypothetical protein
MRSPDRHVAMNRYLLLIITLIAASSVGARQERNPSQQPSIVLGPSVHISTDSPSIPLAESFLSIDPRNPSQFIASAILAGQGESAAIYVSQDSGRSWKRTTSLASGLPELSGGDPIVYFDSSGAALFAGLCDGSDCSLRIWRSSDGGLNWDSTAVVPGRGYDREYLAVDTTTGPFAGRIYVAGTNWVRQSSGRGYPVLGITSSLDGGRTFLPVTTIDVTGDGKSHGFGGIADILITSRGVLFIPIQSPLDLLPGPKRQFWTMISENGGRTFLTPKPGLQIELGPREFRRLRAGSNIRASIDQSRGLYKDRIYVTWVDFDSDRYVVKVTHSDDLGSSWSRAVTVNDASGPDDSSNAAIAVNGDGVLSVVWNDRRDDAKGECYRLYSSASLDGGDTFLPNVQVNAHPTCPNSKGNWSGSVTAYSPDSGTVELTGIPNRYSNGGETQGLVASPDGQFHVSWINGESGVMQLWYTNFRVQGAVQAHSESNANRLKETSSAVAQPATEPRSESVTRSTDHTKDVSLQLGAPLLDFGAKTLGFSVSLKNQTSIPISGHLTLILDSVDSDFAGLAVANSTNGLAGKGAEWKFVSNGPLGPGAVSESQVVKWHFDGRVPGALTKLDVFRANFRVVSDSH